jgi:hypothetical protein
VPTLAKLSLLNACNRPAITLAYLIPDIPERPDLAEMRRTEADGQAEREAIAIDEGRLYR